MVGENLDWKRGAVKVVPERFEGANNRKEFTVVNVVVSFCWGERLREIGAGMPFPVGVGLEEDSARGEFRGVGGDGEGCGEIREV